MNDGQPPPMIAVDLNPEVPGVGYPCRCSLSWHARPAPGGSGYLREWHDPGCDVIAHPERRRHTLDLDAGRPVA